VQKHINSRKNKEKMRDVAGAFAFFVKLALAVSPKNINLSEAIQMVKLDHNNHSVGQSAYHIVIRPKYNVCVFRHPWVKQVCEEALNFVAEKYDITIHEMKVMAGHVHLFIGLPPTLSLSKAFQLLKGISARMIFQKCTKWRSFFSYRGEKKPHLWSPGKFYRSVGNVKADVIENYIANSNKWDFDYLDKWQSTLEAY